MRWLMGGCLVLWVSALSAQAVDPIFGTFERPYKQALFATSMGDAAKAGAALGRSQALWWPAVSAASAAFQPEAVEELAIEVAGRLAVARWQIETGRTGPAHETLEGVRLAMAEFRETQGVFVLNDKLTGFHDPMEHAVLTAVAAEGLAPAELLEVLKAGLPELRSRWAAAAALLGGDAEATRLTPLMDQMGDAVERFAEALDGGDIPAVLASAKALKPAFRDLFLGVEAE